MTNKKKIIQHRKKNTYKKNNKISGLVRDSFHVIRELLDRIDNYKTCEMLEGLRAEIPKQHIEFVNAAAKELGSEIWEKLPLIEGGQSQLKGSPENASELLLNRTWRPQLCVTGVEGIPDMKGGNVLRKFTKVKLSIRIPPSMDPKV